VEESGVAIRKDVLEALKVGPRERFRLKDHDPKWLPPHLLALPRSDLKGQAAELLDNSRKELEVQQDLLYADDRWSLLLVFQAMDAAGKDGTIKHVMSGVNPQGCSVTSFKVPSTEELDHDYLWRYAKALPERGRIGIFNRSYYEEVLVVRVHPEVLARQRLPQATHGATLWKQRYDDINAFEEHLSRNGTKILKFFLNVSKKEQRKRFLDRIDDPSKNWKFSPADLKESAFWDDYQAAFQDAIAATSTDHAPWYVVPADRKWAMRAVVADIVTTTLQGLDLSYPTVSDELKTALADARVVLEAEANAEKGR
jgi:PPK2 family polyphosphate:nucleotide phosphotransferase